MGDNISDYTESRVSDRAPGLCKVEGYYRSEYNGLVEICYKIVINPVHYSWLWLSPGSAIALAIVDASKNGTKHYFDAYNGDFLGTDNKDEARRTVEERKTERREAAERERQRLQREADERERQRLQREAEERERQRLQREAEERERQRLQREADERERQRLQREAEERERQRLQREADERERQRLQREAEEREATQRAKLLSDGSNLVLEDQYEEAIKKFDLLLLSEPNNVEAIRKRDIAQNILDGNKSYDDGDKELEAANNSRLKRDFSSALNHYQKALNHFHSARKGFEQAAKGDSRFQAKLTQVQETVSELEDTIKLVAEEANRAGIKIDINTQADATKYSEMNMEGDIAAEDQTQVHLVKDRM